MNTVVLLLWVVVMGTTVTHLSKLDAVQKMAEKLSECAFPSLHSGHEASAVGLFCKLLDFRGQGPLHQFCPTFATAPLTHSYYLRRLNDNPLSLFPSVQCTSLDLFRRSVLGAITNISASTPLDIRLRGSENGWSTVLKLLQRQICV